LLCNFLVDNLIEVLCFFLLDLSYFDFNFIDILLGLIVLGNGTFSSVAKLTTITLILVLASINNRKLHYN